jgi:hypothetical protein
VTHSRVRAAPTLVLRAGAVQTVQGAEGDGRGLLAALLLSEWLRHAEGVPGGLRLWLGLGWMRMLVTGHGRASRGVTSV